MIITGVIITLLGVWIITQSTPDVRLGPSLATIGLTLILVGVFR